MQTKIEKISENNNIILPDKISQNILLTDIKEITDFIKKLESKTKYIKELSNCNSKLASYILSNNIQKNRLLSVPNNIQKYKDIIQDIVKNHSTEIYNLENDFLTRIINTFDKQSNILNNKNTTEISKNKLPITQEIKTKNPLISIIVPIYNTVIYLKACLNSLINQTYKNIEIICIDDGSTDATPTVLEYYKLIDNRIKVITNKTNLGIGPSRNIGLENSNGKYVMWCDSDDTFDKKMCQIMVQYMEKYNIDVAECNFNIISNKYDQRTNYLLNLHQNKNNKLIKIDDKISYMFVALWNKIFRKSIIDKYNIRFENIPIYEDSCFIVSYYLVSNNSYRINKFLYNYNIIQNSTIDKILTENKDISNIIEIKYINKHIPTFIQKNDLKYSYKKFNDFYVKKITNIYYDFYNILEISNNILKILTPIKPLHIFFSCDNNYIPHLATCITSILKNSPEYENLYFYIIENDISEINKFKIDKLKNIKNFDIEYIKINNYELSNFYLNPNFNYISSQTYYRYLIPQIKPKLSKILYLDCDIIVRKPLSELFDTDLGNNYIGAILDGYKSDERNFVKKYKLKEYFNAGVLLINTKKWNENNITNKLIENTKNLYIDTELNDQDIINYTLKDKIKKLDIIYNLQQFSLVFEENKNYTFEKFKEITEDASIIHYTGSNKPWNSLYCRHPYAMEYFKYRQLTPFKLKKLF